MLFLYGKMIQEIGQFVNRLTGSRKPRFAGMAEL
jgi:hypothetical protein